MATQTAAPKMRMSTMIRQSFKAMTPHERLRVIGMYSVILFLHALGFFVFLVFVVPAHYRGLGIGLSATAYTLGLRHAFDADHISAIDNTTRKVMNERQGTDKPRPFAFGFFFSLGHSTIVVAIGVGIIIAEKTVFAAVSNNGSGLEQFGGAVRHDRLRLLPVPHRLSQPGDPGRDHQGLPGHAAGHVQRGGAGAPAG
jgi:high-affinity nickel permease